MNSSPPSQSRVSRVVPWYPPGEPCHDIQNLPAWNSSHHVAGGEHAFWKKPGANGWKHWLTRILKKNIASGDLNGRAAVLLPGFVVIW